MLKRLKNIGPGAMVAAAFIGPGTVTTATIAGAGFGYTLLWAVSFSIIATIVLQEMSARLGILGGMGLGEAVRAKAKTKSMRLIASVLVLSAIYVGNLAYEAGNISGAVLGFDSQTEAAYVKEILIIVIGILAFILLYSGRFRLIERALIGIVAVMGIVFIASAILVKPYFGEVLKGVFIPVIPENSLLMIVGLIGTTVVPYNLFLHSSSVKKKWSGVTDLKTARWDTIISVVLGGIITMAILITAAAAFGGSGETVKSSSQLSQQLEPVLGSWASIFISFGFLAAGLSSSITAPLAAAFATSEILGKKDDLRSSHFRIVWISILIIGVIISLIGFKPTAVILFAQVANGLLLPVIATFLLLIMNDKNIMKEHRNKAIVNVIGGLVIAITFGLGMKGILSATGVI